MTVALCKHSFPIQPPLGSLGSPGNCTSCDTSWNEVQADLQRQNEALILSTSHDGACPDCSRLRRLFRFQPQDKPWHEIGHEEPVTFLCIDCWNTATEADHADFHALLDAI